MSNEKPEAAAAGSRPAPKRSRAAGSQTPARLSVILPGPLKDALRQHATIKRVSERAVVEQALRAFLHPRNDDSRDAMIARRLQRVDAKLHALTANDKLITETLGVLVQVFLGLSAEPVTGAEKTEFADKIRRRWPRFVDTLTDVLTGRSKGVYDYLPTQSVARPEDFPEPPDGSAPLSPSPAPRPATRAES